jgi:flavin-dependent dehydrogenase
METATAPSNSSTHPSSAPWDVVVVGGALSGGATAYLLKRRNPKLKILIIERSSKMTRRVGEATVEISSYFLTRVLGLTEHLHEKHLAKQGLRYWFKNSETKTLEDCSETGPAFNSRLGSFQVDRSVLDEKVLANAVASGVQLLRPVRVKEITLVEGGVQTITWDDEDGRTGVERAKWVVDASGVNALLARKNGWYMVNHEHPIAACWSRWSGVKNMDSPELAQKFPKWARRTKAFRYTATNHITGLGWWAWVIPLKGGDVSVGVVFDQRITDLPEGPVLGERLREMLNTNPVAAEILADAKWQKEDIHFRRNLAYRSSTFAGKGFALVGDAAAFMDPFYSPGMDWISYTTSATAALIDGCLRGKPAAVHLERHNQRFRSSYEGWFNGIYKDKYFYMADQELMTLAFKLDLNLYYLGVVTQPYKHGHSALERPAFASKESKLPGRFIRLYNARFAKMARDRLRRGVWGKTNAHHHTMLSFFLDRWLPLRVTGLFCEYLWLELREGWRTWFRAPAPFAELPPHATRTQPRKVAGPAKQPVDTVA